MTLVENEALDVSPHRLPDVSRPVLSLFSQRSAGREESRRDARGRIVDGFDPSVTRVMCDY